MFDVVALLRYAAPVGLASLGETVGQKSGVINIGLEGTMLTSAYVAMLGSQTTGSPWLGLLFGVFVAVALTLLQAMFTLALAADQVVVGTAVNLLGLGLTGTLYRARYGGSGQLLSVPVLPRFGSGWDGVLLFWVVAVVFCTWLFARTKWGLAVRATGEYPAAVEASGFSPVALRLHGTLASGVCAGLAGSYLAVGITGSFAENMTAGRGFVALAMVTFGRWNPVGVFLASLLIGYADTLQFELQAKGLPWPPQLLIALPYVVALLVLVFVGKGTAVPAGLAMPFRRSR